MDELQTGKHSLNRKVEALFCIVGENINPDELASIFNILPIKKDDEMKKDSDFKDNNTKTFWAVNSGDYVSDSHINSHVEWLLNKIRPHKELLSTLKRDSANIYFGVWCNYNSFAGIGGYVKKEYLSEIVDLGIEGGLTKRG